MIYVLGSINNDISLEMERMPKKGETLIADSCRMGLGGKGANQAVAIARLARKYDDGRKAVQMIGKVGTDAVGTELKNKLESYGVGVEFVRQVNRSTGTAIVTVCGKNNRIMVYSGANLGISKSDIDEALMNAKSTDTLLCQMEVPMYIVGYALSQARARGMTTILNPAPAHEMPEDMYYNVDVIAPNETETEKLTGINPKDWDSQLAAMKEFHRRGVRYVVLTLGGNGCAISDNGKLISHIPARKVPVVDTTGAGDTFVGALALTYPHVGMYSFEEACIFATRAASFTVSRQGAADSIPSFDEVSELYNTKIEA
ncbi:MAG: ribokinase [Clostridiales bacterium]|nr:ribokinase [Clostridiales bacterium]